MVGDSDMARRTRREADWSLVWQWDQLRIMKVGGNESATKFFQSNGGTAALASKDPKVKYTSNAATKYKEELKRRAARDAQE
jgi:ADP-ribosylation factor GTPase-activating protein 2/3